jgi:hypothetical protein
MAPKNRAALAVVVFTSWLGLVDSSRLVLPPPLREQRHTFVSFGRVIVSLYPPKLLSYSNDDEYSSSSSNSNGNGNNNNNNAVQPPLDDDDNTEALPFYVISASATSVATTPHEPSLQLPHIHRLIRGLLPPRNVPILKQQREEPRRTLAANTSNSIILQAITEPLIPTTVWEQLTGNEFPEHMERIDDLARTGAMLAAFEESNEWITWRPFGGGATTTTSHHHHTRGGANPTATAAAAASFVKDGEIRVWTGRATAQKTEACSYHGGQTPFVKTRSIVPMSVKEMVDLLLDSDRVTTYNPWSLGRIDCWVAPVTAVGADTTPANDDEARQRQQHVTKIVKNRIQPPLGSNQMISTTLLHARPWSDDGSWLVVSRAIGGTRYDEPGDASAGRSDIMLGVNWLQPTNNNEQSSCQLTSVTHVYSSAVPQMLAERLGVKSAIQFVKDMRGLTKKVAVGTQ